MFHKPHVCLVIVFMRVRIHASFTIVQPAVPATLSAVFCLKFISAKEVCHSLTCQRFNRRTPRREELVTCATPDCRVSRERFMYCIPRGRQDLVSTCNLGGDP